MSGFGDQFLQRTKEILGDEWDALPGDAAQQVEECVKDSADLTLKRLQARTPAETKAIDKEIAIVKASIANWSFVGSSRARSALESAAGEVLVYVGSILLGIVAAL